MSSDRIARSYNSCSSTILKTLQTISHACTNITPIYKGSLFCTLCYHFLLLFFFLLRFIFCIWVFCLHVCMCTTCMPVARGCQEGPLGILELGLQTVVNCRVCWEPNLDYLEEQKVLLATEQSPGSSFVLNPLVLDWALVAVVVPKSFTNGA